MPMRVCSLVLGITVVACLGCAAAQRGPANVTSIEREIRRLDSAEAEALLHRNAPALQRIWAADFTVNNPRNGITRGSGDVAALIASGVIDYSSFRREIEEIAVHGATVIVMGNETITPIRNAPFAGQTLRRRYTHFWMKRDGEWRLTARHANVVCPR
jgi:ketosteroid isomerase-like protein